MKNTNNNDKSSFTLVSNEVKQIYDDYFLHNKDGSLKKFYGYINQFYEEKVEDPKLRPEIILKRGEKFGKTKNKENLGAFNTNDLIFNESTHDNVLTHYILHPQFSFSMGKLYKLNKTHPNWLHENKAGMTPLGAIYYLGQVEAVNKICQSMDVKRNIPNKYKEYPSFFFFKNQATFEKNLKNLLNSDKDTAYHFYRCAHSETKATLEILTVEKDIYEQCTQKQITNLKKLWDKKINVFLSENENLRINGVKNPLIQHSPQYTDLIMGFQNQIESIFNTLILDTKLSNKKTSVAKMKI